MDLGWGSAIQAAIIAISTLIIRAGSKKDTQNTIAKTSSPGDVREVGNKLDELRAEFEILRAHYFKQNPVSVDHRGPKKGE